MQQSTSNINDSFFQGTYKDVWRMLIPPGLSEAECSFLEEEAALEKGDPVLDVMCGYGRHAVELARRGYQVLAVDNLKEYIDEINEVAADEHLPVKAIAGGAIETLFLQPYKAIICMGNSFAFFAKDDAQLLLQKVAAHLQPDGIFVINTWMIAEIAIRHFREHEWYRVGDYKYLLEYKYHFQPSRIESEHTLIKPDGSVEDLHGVDYIFTLAELEGMFREAGLYLRGMYSTPKKRPFKMGDNKAYLIVAKTGLN